LSLSSVVRSRTFPRTLRIAATLAALLVLPACWVNSINPLYDEGNTSNPHTDPDVIFDQSLIGSWITTDDKCPTQLTVTAKGQIYDLQSIERGEGCSQDKYHRQARLVKLDNHYFFDVSPMHEDVCDMCAAKHDILLVKFDRSTLSFTPIDSDWLKKSLEAKTVMLSTVAGDTDTITASSKDLKAFCREFADDKAAFKPDSTLVFKRAPAS
jgi:hypothetical protein